jgi:hypothetical protein
MEVEYYYLRDLQIPNSCCWYMCYQYINDTVHIIGYSVHVEQEYVMAVDQRILPIADFYKDHTTWIKMANAGYILYFDLPEKTFFLNFGDTLCKPLGV